MKYKAIEEFDGREIILIKPDSLYPKEVEIVFAKYGSQFVTWERRLDTPKDDLYWGHYFENYEDALQDFVDRGLRL